MSASLYTQREQLGAIRHQDARAVLRESVDAFRMAAESDVAFFYAAEPVNATTQRAIDWTVSGHGTRADGVRGVFESGFEVTSAGAMTPFDWERRFVRFDDIARRMPVGAAKIREDAADPTGVIDQLLLHISHQGRYLGVAAALRFEGERPFELRAANAIRSLATPLAGQLATANRMLLSTRPEEACDLLVDPSGRVEFASAGGRVWLALPEIAQEIRRVVTLVDRGEHDGHAIPVRSASARIVRMESDGRVRYLLQLARPNFHSSRFELTEAERDIAILAATGFSNAEIASMRGTTVGTVKNQMKQIFARVGATTRVELAQLLGV